MSNSFVTPWTVAHQVPLFMGFPRQGYWSGLPFSPPGDLLDQGSNPHLLHWQGDSLSLSHQSVPINKYFSQFSCSVVSDSCVTPWTVAHQAPLSMGFPRQEYWSVLPFPSPGDLPDPGIEARSLALQAEFLLSEPLVE